MGFAGLLILLGLSNCRKPDPAEMEQEQSKRPIAVSNPKIVDHRFLGCMYDDPYFPVYLVDRGKNILLGLCERIEVDRPEGLAALYSLTHAATDEFNDLADAFVESDSEIETDARECIAADFQFIAESYGFIDADVEALISNRSW